MEHTWIKRVGPILTPPRIRSLFRLSVAGETLVPPIHTTLDQPAPKAAPATEDSAYLKRLQKLAASDGHGVDLSKMSDEEVRKRLLGR